MKKKSPEVKAFIYKDLLLLSLLCLILGSIGGVPFFHPDFITGNMFVAIQSWGNPHFFNYPGLVIYVNAFVYGAIFVGMYLFGLVQHPKDFGQLVRAGYLLESPVKISFFLPGHLITVVFSILGVLCSYLLTYKLLRSRSFSLLSGFLLSTSFLWVADSHYITVDIPLASLALLTILLTVIFLEQGTLLTLKQRIILGIVFGLATSAKYNGALLITSIVSAMFIEYGRKYSRWFRDCLIIAIVAVAVFAIMNPFILLDMKSFLRDFSYELKHARIGHYGYTSEKAWWFHLSHTLYDAYGLFLLVMAGCGGIWIAGTNTFGRSQKLAITVFPLLYFVFMGNAKLVFQRYMLPIVPFIAVYAAMGGYGLSLTRKHLSVTHSKFFQRLWILVIIISTIPNMIHAIKHDLLLHKKDVRTDLLTLIREANLDVAEFNIVTGAFMNYLFQNATTTTIPLDTSYFSGEADILLFDSFSYDQFIYDPRLNGNILSWEKYVDWTVVQVSPFTIPKDQVPFSPKSVYSPYLPDLTFRERAGPFLEMYCKQDVVVQRILQVCQTHQIACHIVSGTDGYYFRKLSPSLLNQLSTQPSSERL